jgi:hypothetical protein
MHLNFLGTIQKTKKGLSTWLLHGGFFNYCLGNLETDK